MFQPEIEVTTKEPKKRRKGHYITELCFGARQEAVLKSTGDSHGNTLKADCFSVSGLRGGANRPGGGAAVTCSSNPASPETLLQDERHRQEQQRTRWATVSNHKESRHYHIHCDLMTPHSHCSAGVSHMVTVQPNYTPVKWLAACGTQGFDRLFNWGRDWAYVGLVCETTGCSHITEDMTGWGIDRLYGVNNSSISKTSCNDFITQALRVR